MSHVALVDIEIKDLAALNKACADLGLEFRGEQKTFKWWGTHVGDYPIPAGFTKEDMGKCDHAIGVANNQDSYEVGVVKRRDGKSGYHLMWDFFGGGKGLQAVVGVNCGKLTQAYAEQVVAKKLVPFKAKGWNIQKQKNAQGEIVLNLRKA